MRRAAAESTPEAGGKRRILALTQGDPAGIGPEILIAATLGEGADSGGDYLPILVVERSALAPLRGCLSGIEWDRLIEVELGDDPRRGRARLAALPRDAVALVDPVARRRPVIPGQPGAADAAGAVAALDAGVGLAKSGIADGLVTAPVSKEVIARHHLAGFTGHTDYLAAGCGLERYGRDYLMAFLAPRLQVALLSTHLPLVDAIEGVTREALGEALDCLQRHAGGRIAVAGLNPHAGEGGLLGSEEGETVAPAVVAARARGIDVHGPESADSLFARARRGQFDWVLALYHDQGLIAVKTAAFGLATNWTLGLPFLRTSVDHGTAFDLAGKGLADSAPLRAAIETTLGLLGGELPMGARRKGPRE